MEFKKSCNIAVKSTFKGHAFNFDFMKSNVTTFYLKMIEKSIKIRQKN